MRSLASWAGGQIDFLKMNIEGAERQALAGLSGRIGQVRHAAVSCHDFQAEATGVAGMRTKRFVMGFLAEHGFRVTTREEDPRGYVRDTVYGERQP